MTSISAAGHRPALALVLPSALAPVLAPVLVLALALLGLCLAAGAAPATASEDSADSPRFRDVVAEWNAGFRHHSGAAGDFYMVETLGSGVVLFDYDGDGDTDLFYVDSGHVRSEQTPVYAEEPGSRLLRNDLGPEGPVFVDVTRGSGIEVAAYGMGATAGDVDGDGDLDLYVTAFGPNQLFRNEGDGTFSDVTAEAGVGLGSWSASAAFADADGDGDLDLYVAQYVDFSWQNNPVCGVREKGIRSYCHPDVYQGLVDHFFLGRGDGTFENVSRQAGITAFEDGEPRLGKGLGVVWSDLDDDGRPDVYVANDMTPNFHFANLGEGRFEEIAVLVGTAVSHLGNEEAGMGVASADVDADGSFDLFVTHLDLQTNALYGNLGGGIFVDRRFVAGLGEASMLKVGFGTDFADLDHDGDLDLVVANGHIVHNVELWGTGTTYKQENQVFENRDGKFVPVPSSGVDAVRSSRGLATGDLDLDGDLDLVITNSNDDAEVYENVTPQGSGTSSGWLQIALRGDRVPGGIGAKVALEVGESRQLREMRTASSYLSQNPLRLHFGLGSAEPGTLRLRRPFLAGEPERILEVEGLRANALVRIGSR